MNPSNRSVFVYVTFIRTTPAKLWEALTDREFIRQYWFGVTAECAWTKGAPWKLAYPDGRITDTGEILEIEPPRRLVIRWQNEWRPELKAEGPSRCTIELERLESKLITSVADGWPMVLSNLKSLLETGQVAIAERTQA